MFLEREVEVGGKRVESVLRMHFHWLAMHHHPFEVSRAVLPSYCPAL